MSATYTSTTLTAEMFNQIVSSLKSDAGRRYNEQRTKPRVGVRGRVEIIIATPDGKEVPLEVWVRDLSAIGIGILHSAPFKLGSSFVARFLRHGKPPLDVTYLVAYSKPVTRTLFATGGRVQLVQEL